MYLVLSVLTSGTVTPLVSRTANSLHAVAVGYFSVSVAPAEKSRIRMICMKIKVYFKYSLECKTIKTEQLLCQKKEILNKQTKTLYNKCLSIE